MLFQAVPQDLLPAARCKPAPTPKIEEPEACRQNRNTPALVRLSGEKPLTSSVMAVPPLTTAGIWSETETPANTRLTEGMSRQTSEKAVMTR